MVIPGNETESMKPTRRQISGSELVSVVQQDNRFPWKVACTSWKVPHLPGMILQGFPTQREWHPETHVLRVCQRYASAFCEVAPLLCPCLFNPGEPVNRPWRQRFSNPACGEQSREKEMPNQCLPHGSSKQGRRKG